MEPTLNHTTAPVEEEDAWDTDGFVIPSLSIEDYKPESNNASGVVNPNPAHKPIKEEKIYLGPHGARPFDGKQQDFRSNSFTPRNKSKEADRKSGGAAVPKGGTAMPKAAPRGWVNPH
ncbi:uncharacterized protein LOC144702073 [Wolffia australiana]